MSQRRFVVALFKDYSLAHEAKGIFAKENPDTTYQIRRKRNNTSFAVVKRLASNEPNPTTKSKKRPKKYRYFEDAL